MHSKNIWWHKLNKYDLNHTHHLWETARMRLFAICRDTWQRAAPTQLSQQQCDHIEAEPQKSAIACTCRYALLQDVPL
jgi:hypothetical protein